MNWLCAFLSCVVLFSLSCTDNPGGDKGFQVKQDEKLKQMIPQKPVKIHLKRSTKGSYSWDLRGDDVEKIIEVDRKLNDAMQKQQ